MAAEYEGTVEQVHRAFSDEQYWLVRLQDSACWGLVLAVTKPGPVCGLR